MSNSFEKKRVPGEEGDDLMFGERIAIGESEKEASILFRSAIVNRVPFFSIRVQIRRRKVMKVGLLINWLRHIINIYYSG